MYQPAQETQVDQIRGLYRGVHLLKNHIHVELLEFLAALGN